MINALAVTEETAAQVITNDRLLENHAADSSIPSIVVCSICRIFRLGFLGRASGTLKGQGVWLRPFPVPTLNSNSTTLIGSLHESSRSNLF